MLSSALGDADGTDLVRALLRTGPSVRASERSGRPPTEWLDPRAPDTSGAMVFDETRHGPLLALPWSAQRAQATIARIVDETEARFRPGEWWPLHPKDVEGTDTQPALPLYH